LARRQRPHPRITLSRKLHSDIVATTAPNQNLPRVSAVDRPVAAYDAEQAE
jgi:hypothetical protein